ncbi:L-arabinose transport system permease protein AraQ [Spirochaetia bacterium]|nr:L-arabinose transport system permease protein AraQ [Spirochaetia bacterium]
MKTTGTKAKLLFAKIIITFVLIGISLIVLLPLYYLLLASFTRMSHIFAEGLSLFPQFERMGIMNYITMATSRDGVYWAWYYNSLVLALMYTAGGLFLTSLVGYSLGVYRFKGRNLIFILVLVVMMLPIEILMLPLYNLTIKWHIINTKAGVILPFIVGGNAVFFFRQFSSGLPLELMDAGRIDGATEYGIFFKIMVPLMKPAFGAMTILLAMGSWNMFVWPLIVLRNNRNFTIPIGLASLITPYGNSYEILLPGAVLAVIPVIIIFLFNQRLFVSGLSSGGVKG